MRKLRVHALRLGLIPAIFVAMFVRPRWSLESDLSYYVEFLGYFFLLAGLTVRIWSIFYIGGRKTKTLVTEGPYSLCRNPLYVGTIFLAVGVGLCFENILMFLVLLAVIVLVHIFTVRAEEKHLEEVFGEEFRKYKRRVRRYWPGFHNYHTPDVIPVSVRAIQRIAVDTLMVLLIPEMEDMLELAHLHGLPVLWYFP
ncbi:MAG: isoprenylcysteine carboxylmethyltransferase family protein [Phycisphaerae bacterium]|nr:isoprenylcysteine carboxylmethyltransferase family protein [Phycisphaerae bacterium]